MPVSEIKPPIHKDWKQEFPLGPVLRKTEEFEQENLGAETAYRLSTARVVFANYDSLQHDFPHLRGETLEQKHPELQHLNGTDKTLAIRRLLENWLKTNVAFTDARRPDPSWARPLKPVSARKRLCSSSRNAPRTV